jgi:hypothetical protein
MTAGLSKPSASQHTLPRESLEEQQVGAVASRLGSYEVAS